MKKIIFSFALIGILASPSAFAGSGTLRVNGTLGPEQDSQYVMTNCQTDSSGQPQRFGCFRGALGANSYNFNSDVSLPEGLYEVNYAETSIFVRVAAGQSTMISLQKVTLPQGIQANRFWVFPDLTDSTMLKNFLVQEFSDEAGLDYINQENDCVPPKLAGNKAACNAVLSGKSYQDLLGTYIHMLPGGVASFWNFELSTFKSSDSTPNCVNLRCFASPEASSFASVLPGVYGINYQDAQTGTWEFKRGIRSR